MFRNILEKIEGIGIYPLFSLIVFSIFFTVMFIWVFKADKKYLEKMSRAPLVNHDEFKS